MKIKSVVMIQCALVGMACAGFADGPAPFPIERYQPLMSRSAFAVATEGAVAGPRADFAKDLVLTGVVRFNGGELVTVASRDQKRQFGLTRGQTCEGISIAGVAWSDKPGRTRVTLKRDGKYAVIGFDEAAAFAGPQAVAPAASGSAAAPAASVAPHPKYQPNATPRVIIP